MKKQKGSLKEEFEKLSTIERKCLRNSIITICVITVILTAFIAGSNFWGRNTSITNQGLSQELLRARNYAKFEEGEENIVETEGNVKFSAFFLRDTDLDGKAEKIKGTCKELGTEDTMYMELIVQTGGKLTEGKIEVQGQNFYLQTALPKDKELKENYIGNNIKKLEFNEIQNGTQKLLTGIVRSGDYTSTSQKTSAIGSNKNNYSRTDNKVIFTGKYQKESGEIIDITKEIVLTVDWYGTTKTQITGNTKQTYRTLEDIIDEENNKITLNFSVSTAEVNNVLNIKDTHLEGVIPQLSGIDPLNVSMSSGSGTFNYVAKTRTFTIDKEAVAEEESGKITSSVSKSNSYTIKVEYPLEAYENLGTETVTIEIPVKAYYEGYNNPNTEFNNPYKSNATATI